MENKDKILELNKRLEKNAEKIEQAKEKVLLLEAERKKIEYDRMELIIGDYLPVIEELQLTPAELRELLTGGEAKAEPTADLEQNPYKSGIYESEGLAYEE